MASLKHTPPISSASPGSVPSTGPIKSPAAPVQTVVQQTVSLSDTTLQVVATSAAPLRAVAPSTSQLQAVTSSAIPLEAVAASAASLQAVYVAPSAAPVQTYPKLSRLEEQNILKEELSLVRETKIICPLDLLLDVFKKCQHPGCTQETAIKHHLNGATTVIKWACSAGHKGIFSSSKDQNGIYCNNLHAAASIMLSGNNFAKVEKMVNFLGLSFISDSTFYRMQRPLLHPCYR